MEADARQKALTRELSRRVRNYVRTSESWVKSMKECLKNQVELARFMNSMGRVETDVQELEDVVVPPEPPSKDWFAKMMAATTYDMQLFFAKIKGAVF